MIHDNASDHLRENNYCICIREDDLSHTAFIMIAARVLIAAIICFRLFLLLFSPAELFNTLKVFTPRCCFGQIHHLSNPFLFLSLTLFALLLRFCTYNRLQTVYFRDIASDTMQSPDSLGQILVIFQSAATFMAFLSSLLYCAVMRLGCDITLLATLLEVTHFSTAKCLSLC